MASPPPRPGEDWQPQGSHRQEHAHCRRSLRQPEDKSCGDGHGVLQDEGKGACGDGNES